MHVLLSYVINKKGTINKLQWIFGANKTTYKLKQKLDLMDKVFPGQCHHTTHILHAAIDNACIQATPCSMVTYLQAEVVFIYY